MAKWELDHISVIYCASGVKVLTISKIMQSRIFVEGMTWSVLSSFQPKIWIINGPIFVVDCGFQLCYYPVSYLWIYVGSSSYLLLSILLPASIVILILIISLFISFLWWWNSHFELLQNWFILIVLKAVILSFISWYDLLFSCNCYWVLQAYAQI